MVSPFFLCLVLPVLAQTSKPAPADPDLAGQRELYFPAKNFPTVRQLESAGVVLWTDADLDEKATLKDLAGAEAHLAKLLATSQPARATTSRPVGLAVYKDKKDYLALWDRVGKFYGGEFPKIQTQGYSYRVFCATYFESTEKFQPRRAVLAHEYAHVRLYQDFGLPNDSNWLTEGIAAAVQLELFPQAGDRREYARLAAAGKMLPLKRLLDQEKTSVEDYWQAATLVETIHRHYPGKLAGLIAARNRGQSGYELVSKVLGSDFASLQRQWEADLNTAAGGPTTGKSN